MNLDLIPNGAIKRVHVSQNDVGRTLTFELFNNSTSYTVPSGAVVKIQGTKPSGFGFSETCTVSGNVATIDTTEAMTDESGNIQTELSISYDDVVIGTSNFVLAVEKNPHPSNTTDGTQITAQSLQVQINELAEIIESGDIDVETDTTLSVSGMPADAKVVGDVINFLEDVNIVLIMEQGAITSNAGASYPSVKVSSATRIRTVSLITLDSTKVYYVRFDSSIYDVVPQAFNSEQKMVLPSGTMWGGWKTAPFIVSGYPYMALAVRRKDGTNISPTANTSLRVTLTEFNDKTVSILTDENGYVSLVSPDTTLDKSGTSADAEVVGKAVKGFAIISDEKPNFTIGAYQYNEDSQTLEIMANSARATADLRPMRLAVGDVVGITDYTTYNIAVGDNTHGWYDGGYVARDVTVNDLTILPYVILVKRVDGANITQTDLDSLKAQFHCSSDAVRVRNTKHNNYLHLSFDDVGICIDHLANLTVGTLFDEPFFKMLKQMHDEYGAVFSLYVWDISKLANIGNRFKAEFQACSDWLKFGFHATAEGSLADATYEQALADYNTFISSIFSKCGGVNSVDRIPRLNYFSGNVNALRALRDANCGCIGFLNADDTRSAYYLTQEELTYLRTHSLWSDRTNGLQFISTVMRLDWFVSGFSSQYDYNVPVEDNPYDELVYRYNQPNMADLYSGLIVFTHEWQTYSSSYTLNSAMVDRIEQVCQFANDYGYDFDYPQNRVPNITSYVIQ